MSGDSPVRRDNQTDQQIMPVGYVPGQVIEDQFVPGTGAAQLFPGDRCAIFVKLCPQQPEVRFLNPALAAAVPLLQALATSGRLFETFAVDLRDPSTNPPLLWFQIFDSVGPPVSGVTQPRVSALPLCCTASYVWPDDAFMVDNGLWVALSSTPLVYTAVPASQQFSITARVTT